MHHFYLNDKSLEQGGSFIIKDKSITYQMYRVLRFKPGEKFFVINGAGRKYQCLLKHINKNYVFAEVIERRECPSPNRKIVIAQALLQKKEKMEFVLQKCSELGVGGFEILVSEKTSAKYKPNFPRWEKIITEAIEQSQRCFLPYINKNLISLGEINKKYSKFVKIFLEPSGGFAKSPGNVFAQSREKNVIICVGPEQGWSDFEKDLARNFNWNIININDGVLRSETAALAAAALFCVI